METLQDVHQCPRCLMHFPDHWACVQHVASCAITTSTVSASKRASRDQSVYPPKKRALYKHKLEQCNKENVENLDNRVMLGKEVHRKNGDFSFLRGSLTYGNEGTLLNQYTLLDLKHKIESHPPQKEFTRSRSDSLQSLHSHQSEQSDSVSMTSREPSPYTVSAFHDMRTPERTPLTALASLNSNISKPLFPSSDSDSYHSDSQSPETVTPGNQINRCVGGTKENQLIDRKVWNMGRENGEVLGDNGEVQHNVDRIADRSQPVALAMKQSNVIDQSQNSRSVMSHSERRVYDNNVLKSSSSNTNMAGPMMSLLDKFNAEASKHQPGSQPGTANNLSASAIVAKPSSLSHIKKLNCSVCGLEFNLRSELTSHMKKSHDTLRGKCRVCLVDFGSAEKLNLHMKSEHSGANPYKCEHCDREFGQYNNLRRHMRVHRDKIFKCNLCDREFNEEFYLTMHMGTHTGKRVYSCGVCNACFPSNHDLKLHVKTHSPSELHTCDICHKSFSKACVLRQHKKGHTGERPHKCEKCPKTFIHRHHLTMHMRSHTESKPYTCEVCQKEFYQSSHLYKHMRCHEGEGHLEGSADSKLNATNIVNALGVSSTTFHNLKHRIMHNLQTGDVNLDSSANGNINDADIGNALGAGSTTFENLKHRIIHNLKNGNVAGLPSASIRNIQNTMIHDGLHRSAMTEESEKVEVKRSSKNIDEILRNPYLLVENPMNKVFNSNMSPSEGHLKATREVRSDGMCGIQTEREASSKAECQQEAPMCEAGLVENEINKAETGNLSDKKMAESCLSSNVPGNNHRASEEKSARTRKRLPSASHKDLGTISQTSYPWTHSSAEPNKFSHPLPGFPPGYPPGPPPYLDPSYPGLDHSKYMQHPNPGSYFPHLAPPQPQSMPHPMYMAYSAQMQAYFNQLYLMNHNLLAQNSSFVPHNPYFHGNMPLPGKPGEMNTHTISMPRNVSKEFTEHSSMATPPWLPRLEPQRTISGSSFNNERKESRDVYESVSVKRSALGDVPNVIKEVPNAMMHAHDNKGEKGDKLVGLKLKSAEAQHSDVRKNKVNTTQKEIAEELVKMSKGLGKENPNEQAVVRMHSKSKPGVDTIFNEQTPWYTWSSETSQSTRTEQTFAMDLSKSLNIKQNLESAGIAAATLGRNPNEKYEVIMERSEKNDKKEVDQVNVHTESLENKEVDPVNIYDDSLEEHNLEIDMGDEEEEAPKETEIRNDRMLEDREIVKTSNESFECVTKQEIVESNESVSKSDNLSDEAANSNEEITMKEEEFEKHLEQSEILEIAVVGQTMKWKDITRQVKYETEQTKTKHSPEIVHPKSETKTENIEDTAEKVKTESNFFCCVCFENFVSAESLESHQLTHMQTLTVEYPCQFCEQKFTQPFDLQCHVMMKHQKKAGRKDSISEHVNDKQSDGALVEESIQASNNEVRHQGINNASNVKDAGRQSEPLSESTRKFSNKENVCKAGLENQYRKPEYSANRVMKTKGSPVRKKFKDSPRRKSVLGSNENMSPAGSRRMDENVPNGRSFDCEVCGEYFEKFHAYREHTKIHTEDKPFRCDVCGRDFAHRHNLNRHRMSHNTKTFACTVCSRTFKENFYLQMHLKIHAEENTKKCEICGESVPKTELMAHTNKHLAGISRNPTYAQIGHRVKEILRDGCKQSIVSDQNDKQYLNSSHIIRQNLAGDHSKRRETVMSRNPLKSHKLALRQIENLNFVTNME